MMRAGQAGYTLIEMLVAISMSSLLVLAIGGFATNGVLSTNQDYNKTLVLANAKEAVGVVARQIRQAKSVLTTNSLTDANAPAGGWSGAAGVGSPLILAVPSRDATTKDIIFIDGNHKSVYTDNVIFYLDSATHRLYKRTIANTTLPAGYTNAVKTTCPPSIATASCPADADVVDDVANLSTTYLDSSGAVVPAGDFPGPTYAVSFTVTETRTISGKTYSGVYSTIASMRNK
jgi:prepilin-type N-terminal cleavage/methylation domain-containing protein